MNDLDIAVTHSATLALIIELDDLYEELREVEKPGIDQLNRWKRLTKHYPPNNEYTGHWMARAINKTMTDVVMSIANDLEWQTDGPEKDTVMFSFVMFQGLQLFFLVRKQLSWMPLTRDNIMTFVRRDPKQFDTYPFTLNVSIECPYCGHDTGYKKWKNVCLCKKCRKEFNL